VCKLIVISKEDGSVRQSATAFKTTADKTVVFQKLPKKLDILCHWDLQKITGATQKDEVTNAELLTWTGQRQPPTSTKL